MTDDGGVLLRETTPWGVRLVLNRPDKLNAFVRSEYDRWIKVIRDAGISLD